MGETEGRGILVEIKLARTAGFCMGVQRAIDLALRTAATAGDGMPIYTCGPLIHNPQAVAELESKGIRSVDDWRSVSAGTLIIRAHGMPVAEIEEMRARGLTIVDATCPHVVSSQNRIKTAVSEGYFVVIVGDPHHPEILSLQSFALGNHLVIASVEEVASIPPVPKAIVIAQTTFHEKQYELIAQAVSDRIPECRIIRSICKATSNRQAEVEQLAAEVEAMVVVGGRDSANTRRLAEIAESRGVRTVHIETAIELDPAFFRGVKAVGVTAGASTPSWITRAVIERLETLTP